MASDQDETLTVIAFGLPRWLERTLATTNVLENLNGHVRTTGSSRSLLK